MAEEVKDRSAEFGIKINNILTGLILAAILWVGSTIEELKEMVWGLVADQRELQQQITVLEKRNVEQDVMLKEHEDRLRKQEIGK